MKACTVFFCIVSALITLVNTQSNLFGPFLDAHEACQENPETRIVGNLMDMAAAGQPVDEVSFGNHMLCMYLRLGIMSRDGRVNAGRTIDLLTDVLNDRPVVSRAVHRCCGPRRPFQTPQQVASELFKCVTRNLPGLSTVKPPASEP